MTEQKLYWHIFNINKRDYIFAATQEGLCYVKCTGELLPTLEEWAQKRLPAHSLQKSKAKVLHYKAELDLYFKGNEHSFTEPLALYGTPFQISVWRALQSIPYGQTLAYSDIAEAIGKPTAVRAVATAIGSNPLLIFTPCHRVIGKDGSLTGFYSGIDFKKELLTLENNTSWTSL